MTRGRLARRLAAGLTVSAAVALLPAAAPGHGADKPAQRLPVLGPAPDFTLTDQRGAHLALSDLEGKVVAVTFIFAGCVDVCPLLTDKMVGVQEALGDAFGRDVHFVSITADPEADRPEVLKAYAETMGADTAGWSFLTGTEAEIDRAARNLGVFIERHGPGKIDHNLLTTIIDRGGTMRVQYMGQRFDPDEFLHDLRDLVREDGAS